MYVKLNIKKIFCAYICYSRDHSRDFWGLDHSRVKLDPLRERRCVVLSVLILPISKYLPEYKTVANRNSILNT